MEIFYTSRFRREAKRLPVTLRRTVEDRLSLFITDPFHPSLKTHKLSGSLKGFLSFSIDYRIRIIFEFVEKSDVLLHSIGDHSIYDS